MRGLLLLLGLIALQSPLSAALPPLYQGIREIDTLLHDPQIGEVITAGEVLESITKNSTGYELTTNRSHVQVDVEHVPQEHPGPAKFVLHFHKI